MWSGEYLNLTKMTFNTLQGTVFQFFRITDTYRTSLNPKYLYFLNRVKRRRVYQYSYFGKVYKNTGYTSK